MPLDPTCDGGPVRPDGLAIRGRRHARGWSLRDLAEAIGDATERERGLRESLTPSVLRAVEEQGARIPFATLRLIAAGLDCNPVDLLAADPPPEGGGDQIT